MAFAISRQIKLRSVEQAIFSPAYNRLNFFIQPDGLSTDLSQSYLSMRVYLTSALTGVRLTGAQMRELIANNLVVSFGNGEQSYSPACMLRTARLFANRGNELLEEINFCNVLTQTIMNQLCNDFETLESTNLLTGSSNQIGHGSSLPATLSAFINNPTEVHIFLRDIFGICRHSNFELQETDGLNITIELEDKQNLFRVTTLGDFTTIVPDVSGNTAAAFLPETFINPVAMGYNQNVNTLAITPIAPGQFSAPSSNLFLDGSGNKCIQYPKEGFYFDSAEWFEQPAPISVIDTITLKAAYTAPQLTALGFVAGAFLKLHYDITSSYTGADNVAPKTFDFMVEIESATAGAAGSAFITFTNDYSLWINQVPGRTVNETVTFTGLELLRADEVVVVNSVAATTPIATVLASNQLTFSAAQYTQLKQMGLIDATDKPISTSFDIGVQMEGATASAIAGTHIMPDQILNETSQNIRKIYSNQITKLPTQGAKTRITDIGAADASGNVLITFSSWGCESNTSVQGFTIIPTGDTTYSTVAALSANFYIWNVENLRRAPNGVDLTKKASLDIITPGLLNNLSYEIDRFELVLIQSSIDPQNRMPRPFIYSTWKLETATIETAQPTYARQFILEENVYNCFLLTPDWNQHGTDKGSLVSTRRGVSYYRYSVNQVNQTNRDIYLSNFRTSYPSTLYLDRLNDTFSNSDYILRSPVGIKGVQEVSQSVVTYPLKIYHAVSEQAYVMGHPGGATVQINLFADTASTINIVPGNIFFYKQVLKQLM